MAGARTATAARDADALPQIRKIKPADLRDALAKGFADFWAIPSYVVFIFLIYPVVGVVLWRLSVGNNLLPMVFPLAAGYALIGPFAAVGLYELSRRREKGLDTTWTHAFEVFRSHSIGPILALGAILMVVFVSWLAFADYLYQTMFGVAGEVITPSVATFVEQVTTTQQGWTMAAIGIGVGFLLAVLVLAISVVSFPLLLDRNVGASIAAVTSIKACLRNPGTMALWGLIVVVALLLGALPFFIGLAIALPVLGHSTWHLYRKVVTP